MNGRAPDYVIQTFIRRLPPVSYTHLRAHETRSNLVCRLLLEKKKPAMKKATIFLLLRSRSYALSLFVSLAEKTLSHFATIS